LTAKRTTKPIALWGRTCYSGYSHPCDCKRMTGLSAEMAERPSYEQPVRSAPSQRPRENFRFGVCYLVYAKANGALNSVANRTQASAANIYFLEITT
ncbi:MAG: hypothetical protein KDE47_24960, partial [Caldilineaceae bacterium]|nr:hypothetical protein [Caldilineaceae bacterium]